MTSLQTEIRDSLNAVIGDGVVTDVYFPEFVMQ
jgi:flagellar basal body-associated protein FliL